MAHNGGLVRRESVETEMRKSELNTKTFVYTKKRGYDVTRNPHLNKVVFCRISLRQLYWPQSAVLSVTAHFNMAAVSALSRT